MPLSTVRRNLWSLRLYYFVWIGGSGFLFPFITLFYTGQGLTGAEIGWLSTFGSITALIVAPGWGRFSDRMAQPRRLLQFGLLVSASCMFWLSQQVLFAWMAVLVIIEALLSAGVAPLSDALTLSVTRGGSSGYGSVRLWGSLGWAVTALVGGGLIERTGLFAMFGGYAISAVVCIALVALIDTQSFSAPARSDAPSARATTRTLLANRALIGLALALAVAWFTTTGFHQFEPIYLKQLGAGELIIGLASTIGALIELPGMLWADRLVRGLGADRLLRLSFALDVVRLGGILIAPSVPMILISHAINGLSYSFYAIALIEFIGEHAPDRQMTTTLAVFTVTLPGLIRILAAPAGGWLFDALGTYWLYAVGLGGTLIAWLVMRLMVSKPAPASAIR
jgi:PPP family 3-phenylpropionic acid transporter